MTDRVARAVPNAATEPRLGFSFIVKKAVQNTLLVLYRLIRSTGALATPAGRRIFLAAYVTYKWLWEPDLSHLRGLVRPCGWVVDIGANVGYFSRKFCAWVSGGGRVLAFEPELENFKTLAGIASQPALGDLIECRQCLVAELDGELPLALNPDNPADHRIGKSGIMTRCVRLDTVMAELTWPAVSLIKIDVQGGVGRWDLYVAPACGEPVTGGSRGRAP